MIFLINSKNTHFIKEKFKWKFVDIFELKNIAF